MTVGGILGGAFDLYRRFFAQLVLTALPVFVVLGLVSAIAGAAIRGGGIGVVFWVPIHLAIGIVGYFWLQGALVEAVADIRDGRADLSVGELYARVQPRLPGLIAAGLVAALAVGVGLLLLIVPGLFLLTRWSLIGPAIVLEGRSAGDALSRSWELIKGHSWTAFGVIVVTALIAGIAGSLIESLFVFLPDFLATWVGSALANSITAPFIVLAWTLMYFELTGREESQAAAQAPVL